MELEAPRSARNSALTAATFRTALGVQYLPHIHESLFRLESSSSILTDLYGRLTSSLVGLVVQNVHRPSTRLSGYENALAFRSQKTGNSSRPARWDNSNWLHGGYVHGVQQIIPESFAGRVKCVGVIAERKFQSHRALYAEKGPLRNGSHNYLMELIPHQVDTKYQ